MKIVTSEEMRELERRSEAEGISSDALMEQAGLAVAQVARRELTSQEEGPVLVLVGPGNNGGDGLVAARHLAAWGIPTSAYLAAGRSPDDSNLLLARDAGVRVVDEGAESELTGSNGLLGEACLVVDAVLGTGRGRPLEGRLAILFVNLQEERERRPILKLLALDLPTGLNADTGEIDPTTPVADVTVTLGCPKIGLFRFPGAHAVGRLVVADIGIPSHLLGPPSLELLSPWWARNSLPSRPLNAHKGSFGRVLVVAGSPSYIGAAYLACVGAARVGAGYVTLATSPSIQSILAVKLTETTYVNLPEGEPGEFASGAVEVVRQASKECDALLLGCGLGQHPATGALVRNLLRSRDSLGPPLVLDADALNLLAAVPEWWKLLNSPAVVTPHPGEMARLVESSVAQVEEDRLRVAGEAAVRWGVTVLLKGAFTVIASPQGQTRVVPFANPALATAGTGDVLAGAVAGLLAQGLSPFDAASVGAFVHGAAGEMVVREVGPAGAIASDLLPMLPKALQALREGSFSGGVAEEP